MPVEEPPTFSAESMKSASALPNVQLATSLDADWTSLLLELREGGRAEPFDVLPTPDQTIVVTTRHEHALDVFRGGRWRSVVERPGSISTSAPGESPRLRSRCSGGIDRFVTAHVYIPGQVFSETAEEYRRAGQSPRHDSLSALALTDAALAEAVSALLRAAAAGAPDLYAQNAARWIASHLLCRTGAFDEEWLAKATHGGLTDRRLARVIEFMSAHMAEALSIERLAAEAGISKHHFARLFRNKTGRTPHEYLTTLRIEAACRLLATSDLSIAGVGFACGYPRPNNFASAFRRRLAMTPADYRIKAR